VRKGERVKKGENSRKCLICIRSRKTSRISLGSDTKVICRWWSVM